MEKLAFPRENYGADPPSEFSNLFDSEQREPTADSCPPSDCHRLAGVIIKVCDDKEHITKGPTPWQIEQLVSASVRHTALTSRERESTS